MTFIHWVMALAIAATAIAGGASYYQSSAEQLRRQAQHADARKQTIERYRLQQQLQRHHEFLRHYQG